MALNKKIENIVIQVDPKNNLVQILRTFGDSQKDVGIVRVHWYYLRRNER